MRFLLSLAADRHDALRRDAARDLLTGLIVLLPLSLGAALIGDLGGTFVATVLALYAGAAALVWRGLPSHRPHGGFGAANRVTLVRLALALALAALLGVAVDLRPELSWGVVAVATVAALLDALDGVLARRRGLASAFGARFDMETDALLIAVLTLLIVHFDKAGPWVLLAGALRYGFVAAAWRWRWMARPLPPSTRRKTVCVVQIVTLITALGPVVGVPWSGAIAGIGLAALISSFAIDTAWLYRARHRPAAGA